MPAQHPQPRLWTIPPSAAFLDRLADAISSGRLVPGGHALSDYLILLPTRRACRALTDLLVKRAGEKTILLPRIRPIGDVDEAALALEAAERIASGAEALDLPPAIEPLRRHVLLTELVLQWGRTVARTLLVPGRNEPVAIPVRPGDAALMARDLARLMDDFETETLSFSALDDIVPDHHANYWRLTLEFLRIATEEWPRILKDEAAIDPATRRDALLRAEATKLRTEPPSYPVIAAGSTGTIPATAELLSVIARLPLGAVVLPGLDETLDEDSWAAIDVAGAPHPAHPQYGLKKLLRRLGATRDAVECLASAERVEREQLVSEALRPPATTDRWATLNDRLPPHDRKAALGGLSIIEAVSEREEATAIALLLREAVETPEHTAVLVTPDRGLARRVSAELLRWDVALDDSAGVPLSETPAGVLFRLAADVAATRLAPAPLVALLQHPLASFGMAAGEARRAARNLELLALRGPRPAPGGGGLLRVVERASRQPDGKRRHPLVARLDAEDRSAALRLAQRIAEAFAPLEAIADTGEIPLAQIIACHDHALRLIASKEEGACAAFEGPAGQALDDFLVDLLEASNGFLSLALDDYPALLDVLMAGPTVRPTTIGHPRLAILGPLEARLLSADLIVLGGLNEGSWPADIRSDPFLNRPMRSAVRLEAPERFIGLAAHDLAQLVSAPSVVLTRAARAGGEPTVPSRWLQRLKAVAGKAETDALLRRGSRYLDWARLLDQAEVRESPQEPLPCPARALRPRQLSVTEIETLIRDPYAIYAKRILGLQPLDELDAAPDAAARGSLVHDAMRRFDEELEKGSVTDPVECLITIGRDLFRDIEAFPELGAIWWPRFQRLARWFAPLDAAERALLAARHTEASGRLDFPATDGQFRLTCRADRIDVAADGALRIVDYKTGGVPTRAQVESGLAPQLPLEAAIARAGGFDAIPAGRAISGLTYIALKGGNPPGDICDIEPKQLTLDALADATLQNLRRLLTRFADERVPYRAKTHVQQLRFATEYDHLSRFAEWSVASDNEV